MLLGSYGHRNSKKDRGLGPKKNNRKKLMPPEREKIDEMLSLIFFSQGYFVRSLKDLAASIRVTFLDTLKDFKVSTVSKAIKTAFKFRLMKPQKQSTKLNILHVYCKTICFSSMIVDLMRLGQYMIFIDGFSFDTEDLEKKFVGNFEYRPMKSKASIGFAMHFLVAGSSDGVIYIKEFGSAPDYGDFFLFFAELFCQIKSKILLIGSKAVLVVDQHSCFRKFAIEQIWKSLIIDIVLTPKK